MQITISGNLATILAPLKDLPERAKRAMREGLQEGGNKVRTKVRKALQKQMGLKKYGTITKNTTGTLDTSGFSYIIRGNGKGLPIEDFPVKGKAAGGADRWSKRRHYLLQPRVSGRFGRIKDVPDEVTASPWAVSRLFKRSFVGANGYRAALRVGGRVRLRKLYGPSVAKEIVKGASIAAFHASVRVDVIPAIDKRLARIVS